MEGLNERAAACGLGFHFQQAADLPEYEAEVRSLEKARRRWTRVPIKRRTPEGKALGLSLHPAYLELQISQLSHGHRTLTRRRRVISFVFGEQRVCQALVDRPCSWRDFVLHVWHLTRTVYSHVPNIHEFHILAIQRLDRDLYSVEFSQLK